MDIDVRSVVSASDPVFADSISLSPYERKEIRWSGRLVIASLKRDGRRVRLGLIPGKGNEASKKIFELIFRKTEFGGGTLPYSLTSIDAASPEKQSDNEIIIEIDDIRVNFTQFVVKLIAAIMRKGSYDCDPDHVEFDWNLRNFVWQDLRSSGWSSREDWLQKILEEEIKNSSI